MDPEGPSTDQARGPCKDSVYCRWGSGMPPGIKGVCHFARFRCLVKKNPGSCFGLSLSSIYVEGSSLYGFYGACMCGTGSKIRGPRSDLLPPGGPTLILECDAPVGLEIRGVTRCRFHLPNFASRPRLQISHPNFNSGPGLQISIPNFTSQLHLLLMPTGFASRFRLLMAPPDFASRFCLPNSTPGFTSA